MPNAIGLSDNRQPRYATHLDRSNPLTRGLIGALHWGWQHRAVHNPALRKRGQVTTAIATPASFQHAGRGGMQGLACTTETVGAYAVVANEDDASLTGGAVYTLLRYRDTTLTSRNGSFFGAEDSGTSSRRFGVHAPFADGTTYYDFGGATAGTTRVTWAGLGGKNVNKVSRWCMNAGAQGMQIFYDGILRASHTTPASRTNASANRLAAFTGNVSSISTGESDLMDIFLLLIWNRGLATGEVRELDHNPWQVFATSDINRSFVPAAAIAPSTSGRIAGFGGFGAMGIG